MSTSRSRHQVGRGYLGPHPDNLWLVIERAWEHGISVSSDFARHHAAVIALAASIGWISSVSLSGKRYERRWNVTAEGITAHTHIRNNKQVP